MISPLSSTSTGQRALVYPSEDHKPQYDDKQQYTVVHAGAVPVMSGDQQFFLEENLRQYAEGKETTYVTVGGLRVFDPSAWMGSWRKAPMQSCGSTPSTPKG